MSREYFVTFGQRYRLEQHPVEINGVRPHPDGWFVIEADNYEEAKQKAFEAFDGWFAFIYFNEPSIAMYRRGELGRIL